VDFGVVGAGAKGIGAIITPHHFFIRSDFGKVLHPGEKNVAVGQHPHVVIFVALAGGISPDRLAILNDEHFVVILADVEQRMLRQALAGQVSGRDAIRPTANRGHGFFRTHRRHIGGGKTVELGQTRRRQRRLGGGRRLTTGQSQEQTNG